MRRRIAAQPGGAGLNLARDDFIFEIAIPL
jgi:hypothetical protein